MTETQANDSQAIQRSKKAATIAREQIRDIAVLGNDAVFSGAWSWPVKVCVLVIVLPIMMFLTIQRTGTAASILSSFTPESHQVAHNQIDRSHVRNHCGSVRRWLSPDCGSPGVLQWAIGLRSCHSGHLGCWFCHRNISISYHLAIERPSGLVRRGPYDCRVDYPHTLPTDAPFYRSSYRKVLGRS